jgi:hypothetical protein
MARVISLLTVFYNGEDFLEMNQSETRIAVGSIYGRSPLKNAHFVPIY